MSKKQKWKYFFIAIVFFISGVMSGVFSGGTKDEYTIMFNDRDSFWEYRIFDGKESTERAMGCSLSTRINSLTLKKNGKYIGYQALCGRTLREMEVDY